jgi:AraC-like DNA-binding protein
MSNKRQHRSIPALTQLPRPVYARSENWDHSGSQTLWHSHAWGQWSYAIKGVLVVHTHAGRFVAPPQYAIWVPEGIEHQVISSGAAQMRSLYIRTGSLINPCWHNACVCDVTTLAKELLLRFGYFDSEYKLNGKEDRLANVLLDTLDDLPQAQTQLPMPTDKRLLAIFDYLHVHTGEQINIDQIGHKVELSGRSVSRLFKQETGLTFQQWRQRLRLLSALNLLEQAIPVTQVAMECGYESLSAFVAAFGKQFGETPGKYF